LRLSQSSSAIKAACRSRKTAKVAVARKYKRASKTEVREDMWETPEPEPILKLGLKTGIRRIAGKNLLSSFRSQMDTLKTACILLLTFSALFFFITETAPGRAVAAALAAGDEEFECRQMIGYQADGHPFTPGKQCDKYR
jgi:hypothetical protein